MKAGRDEERAVLWDVCGAGMLRGLRDMAVMAF